MSSHWSKFLACLTLGGCTLTSSLDDLQGGLAPDAGGGSDAASAAGGTAGSGGAGLDAGGASGGRGGTPSDAPPPPQCSVDADCMLPNATAACQGGQCAIVSCTPPWEDCDDTVSGCETALNTTTDCGACGVPCARDHATASCADGTCQLVECNPGYDDCEPDESNGCETALGTDTDCASCGDGCAAGLACVSGSCHKFRQVAVGDWHTCVVYGNGDAYCWGRNEYGQLGIDNQATPQRTPQRVALAEPVVAIAAGRWHTCARTAAGALFCWGRNTRGEVGNGGTMLTPSPAPVAVMGEVAEIDVGDEFSCARLRDGRVRCWGSDDNGRLGNGLAGASFTPAIVQNITDAVSISAGQWHACAVRATGAVSCWGENGSSQLGNDSMMDSQVPVAVRNISDAVAVSAGRYHTCVLRQGGRVSCFGSNVDGQLGIGVISASERLAVDPIDSGIVELAGGRHHHCARDAAGNVSCWGLNDNGQLGDDSTTTRPSPVPPLNLGIAIQIAAGGSNGTDAEHTCALLADESVACWGNGQYGQLGDNDAAFLERDTPTAVLNLP